MSSSSGRQVSSLLHALRGEDFRRLQNQRRSRSHLTSFGSTSNTPSLPPLDFDITLAANAPSALTDNDSLKRIVSGPPPPASWVRRENSQNHNIANPESPTWKRMALAPFLYNAEISVSSPRIPPLRELCMLFFLQEDYFLLQDFIPYLSPDMKRQLSRSASINRPFTSEELIAVHDPASGGADGEFIAVGPNIRLSTVLSIIKSSTLEDKEEELTDWDAENQWEALDSTAPYHSLALVNIPLTPSSVPSFPVTLTRLALIHLPWDQTSPIPSIRRLPAYLPLLTFIDLSFNSWLKPTKEMEKVAWISWTKLNWVGLRGCGYNTLLDQLEVTEKLGPRFKRHGTVVFDAQLHEALGTLQIT